MTWYLMGRTRNPLLNTPEDCKSNLTAKGGGSRIGERGFEHDAGLSRVGRIE